MEHKIKIEYCYDYCWIQMTLPEEEGSKHTTSDIGTYSHMNALRFVESVLMKYGIKVGSDEEVDKKFPLISDFHRCYQQNGCECKVYIRSYCVGFRLKTCDTAQYPYMASLRCKVMINRIVNALKNVYPDAEVLCVDDKRNMTAKERIVYHYNNKTWHMKGVTDVEKISEQAPKCGFAYVFNNTDKKGRTLLPGQTKYFYDSKGHLNRGIVYYNINNMWFVVLNDREYTNMACFDLFDRDCEPFKKDTLEEQIHHIERKISSYANAYDWQRCIKLHKTLLKLQERLNNKNNKI